MFKDYFKEYIVLSENTIYLKVKAKTGPSYPTKIPLSLTNELAFLIGIILGDGHLTKNKKRIALEMSNSEIVYSTKKLFELLFGIRLTIHQRQDKRPNRKLRYYFYVYNSMIYHLFNKIGVPIGNKSRIISVPDLIKKSSEVVRKSFLLGVFCAEGGKRRWRYYGLSSSSREFRDDVVNLLKSIGIDVKKDKWLYKKYKKEYFGLYFEKESLKTLRECRSGQTGRILNRLQKLLEV